MSPTWSLQAGPTRRQAPPSVRAPSATTGGQSSEDAQLNTAGTVYQSASAGEEPACRDVLSGGAPIAILNPRTAGGWKYPADGVRTGGVDCNDVAKGCLCRILR